MSVLGSMTGMVMTELVLKHFGPIASGTLPVANLTVLAGANGSGKSTAVRALAAILKTRGIWRKAIERGEAGPEALRRALIAQLGLRFGFGEPWPRHGTERASLTLHSHPGTPTSISLAVSITAAPPAVSVEQVDISSLTALPLTDAVVLSTPLIWDLVPFFRAVAAQRMLADPYDPEERVRFPYPYELWDLYLKLEGRSGEEPTSALESIRAELEKLLGGRILADAKGQFRFQLNDQGQPSIALPALASGFKALGLWQALMDAGSVQPWRLFIVDEPENHLHPRWQILYAQWLVRLAKAGIHLMLSTHSPYLLEGLEIWSRRLQVPTAWIHAQLTDDGAYLQPISPAALDAVYDELAEAYQRLERLDAELCDRLDAELCD